MARRVAENKCFRSACTGKRSPAQIPHTTSPRSTACGSTARAIPQLLLLRARDGCRASSSFASLHATSCSSIMSMIDARVPRLPNHSDPQGGSPSCHGVLHARTHPIWVPFQLHQPLPCFCSLLYPYSTSSSRFAPCCAPLCLHTSASVLITHPSCCLVRIKGGTPNPQTSLLLQKLRFLKLFCQGEGVRLHLVKFHRSWVASFWESRRRDGIRRGSCEGSRWVSSSRVAHSLCRQQVSLIPPPNLPNPAPPEASAPSTLPDRFPPLLPMREPNSPCPRAGSSIEPREMRHYSAWPQCQQLPRIPLPMAIAGALRRRGVQVPTRVGGEALAPPLLPPSPLCFFATSAVSQGALSSPSSGWCSFWRAEITLGSSPTGGFVTGCCLSMHWGGCPKAVEEKLLVEPRRARGRGRGEGREQNTQ